MAEVVVLAGGKGTRLAPYTAVFPKPLMPVGDMPVLEILLRRLAAAGFTRVHLAVGHLAELIEAYFGDGSRFGVELVYWRENEPLGTAGPLATIETSAEHLLVMNGDLFTTLDFRDLLTRHEQSGATATIAVLRREIPIEFGVVQVETDRVVGFEEKPTITYDVSMGVYVFDRSVARLIEAGTPLDFPDLLARLLARGDRVDAFRSNCFWLDIGRPEDYAVAVDRFEELRLELLGGP
ncbi:MAG TPA: sugar phosphate nucleotidyltransferase [Gaiellaceae bacterium]|nr:sugar phosphate nucleotidyltransferase [Gaiellaceae bacterium]